MKIYILCPAYVATGGVELVHQFQYKLNMLDFETYIYYVDTQADKNPILPPYKKYNVKRTDCIEDVEENVIVFPEIYIDCIPYVSRAKKVVWWMSVDNAKCSEETSEILWNDESITHLVQSVYAQDYVKMNGVSEDRIKWLSDYINSEYLHTNQVSSQGRGPVVLFNPRKGYEMTAKIIENSKGNIRWIALTGFTPEGLRKLMQESKVYIDFGNHPGRDRIPREAAMCGCLVITNKRGAAANPVDVLIDDKYKFDSDHSPEKIVETITKLITEYDERIPDYIQYIKRTAREFQSFEIDIYNIFVEIASISLEKTDAIELKANMLNCIYKGDYEEAFRALIKYKVLGYDEDAELIIIEANIRIALGEVYEAEYLLKEGLETYPKNYEMLIMLASIHSTLNTKEDMLMCVEECQQAIEYSSNTPDEGVIRQEGLKYLSDIKKKLSENI